MIVKVTQIRNNKIISSVDINLPNDINYIKEIHRIFMNNFPNNQINFYWQNHFLLGMSPEVVKNRTSRLKAYNHKFKIAI